MEVNVLPPYSLAPCALTRSSVLGYAINVGLSASVLYTILIIYR